MQLRSFTPRGHPSSINDDTIFLWPPTPCHKKAFMHSVTKVWTNPPTTATSFMNSLSLGTNSLQRLFPEYLLEIYLQPSWLCILGSEGVVACANLLEGDGEFVVWVFIRWCHHRCHCQAQDWSHVSQVRDVQEWRHTQASTRNFPRVKAKKNWVLTRARTSKEPQNHSKPWKSPPNPII